MAFSGEANATLGKNWTESILEPDRNQTFPINGSAPRGIDANQYWQHRASETLWSYFSPVIILAGIIFNSISLAVLNTKSFRRTSFGFILSALAVVDSLILLTPFLRQWIRHMTPNNLDVRTLSSAGCHFHFLLTYLLPQLSSWTLVLVTIERMVSVLYPFIAKEIFSKRRMIIVWFSLAATLFLINIHSFWTIDYLMTPRGALCFYQYPWFWVNIWRWIDCCLMSFIPCAVIIVCNTLTIRALWKTRTIRRSVRSSKKATESRRMSSTTVMLIVVSTVFILTTTPSVGYFIYIDYFVDLGHLYKEDPKALAEISFAYCITSMLYYLNNTSNFALYCISGSRFRQAFIDMLSCRPIRDFRLSEYASRRSRSSLATQSSRFSRTSQDESDIKETLKTGKITKGVKHRCVLESVAENDDAAVS